MAARTVRLVDGEREFLLHRAEWPREDVILTNLDAPAPAVRAATQDRTDADGTDDATTHHGARAVSVELTLLDDPMRLVDELNAFLHPRSRPYLIMDDEAWETPRRLRLRVDQFSAPLPRESHLFVTHQMQWQAPDGVWEAVDPFEFEVSAETTEQVGRIYPFVLPRTYPGAQPTGRVELFNPGSAPSDYKVRLYGPCNGPRFTDDESGATIAFTEELSLQVGEYVEVDTRDRTVFAMSDPDASRLGYLDFELSSWWQLQPGQNVLRYNPLSGVDVGCAAAGAFRPRWL